MPSSKLLCARRLWFLQISGSIPASWHERDAFSRMVYFSVSNNRLAGTLPRGPRGPSKLLYLSLSRNG